ncbi:MAG: DUF1446 domain-containing protein [Pirellulaceae bacterium]|nr:DUF1446 domain-containing protein [Pirellulaceae bacterium]
MNQVVRIGNAQAFWGDSSSAAAQLLSQCPDLDYLTMDYLAEVSMSILAVQRDRRPELGYPLDFVKVVQSLADYWASGGRCRLIANSGGLNPLACALACQQALEQRGCRELKIAVVSGDDVLMTLKADPGTSIHLKNLDDGRPLSEVQPQLVTANAYVGCEGMVRALQAGADIVITGRVADPSMVLAACVHAFNWSLDDWPRLAQGTVAGHLLECGTHVTGGISTDWLQMPDLAHIGFPIVEIDASGRIVVTKPTGTGGRVTPQTVKEQLVYEIGDPAEYLSPDVRVSFTDLQVRQIAQDRVEVIGAIGSPRPETLKVSATYRDGYRAAGMLTIYGHRSQEKARLSGQIVLQRLADAGWQYRDTMIECLGHAASVPVPDARLNSQSEYETVMRVAVQSDSQAAVEAFSQELMPLVTAGAQGTTGYAEGRPRVHPIFRYWPCLIRAQEVPVEVQYLTTSDTLANRQSECHWPPVAPVSPPITSSISPAAVGASTGPTVRRLIDIAYGRSGDKGTSANIGILVRDPGDYPWLCQQLTVERVGNYFRELTVENVTRYELPNLGGLNFLLSGVLRRGLRNDAQGKALAQALLAMPLELLEQGGAQPPSQTT